VAPRPDNHGLCEELVKMNPTKVVVIDKPGANHLKALDTLPASVNVEVSNQAALLREFAQEADVILNGIPDGFLLRDIFTHATHLRWIHSLSTGVEKILFPELVASPVILTNARGVFKRSLAEFVIGAVLYFAKDFRRLIRSQQAGAWQPFEMDEAYGKAMGIVGYGATGRACAERAYPLGMEILGLRRRPELSRGDPWLKAILGPGELDSLLAESDYVVLATPATPQTRRLIGKAEFAVMKASAVLINIGRGSLVDEAALIDALEQGRIRGAALDVYEIEPLPPGHPFYRLENVLVSPHCADHTPGFSERDMEVFMQNLQCFLNGEPLHNVVDKRAGY
jgi:phosphoglycerate dehydrogenase-like enzyme